MTIMQQIGRVSTNIENATRTSEFVSFAKCLAAGRGRLAEARAIAKNNGASTRVIELLKDAATAGTTSDPNWAGALADYRTLSSSFISGLKNFSAMDRVLTDAWPVPLYTRLFMAALAGSGASVNEGEAKPIIEMAFSAGQITTRKTSCTVAISDELARSTAPEALDLITQLLRVGVAVASDELFLSLLTDQTGVASATSSGIDATSFLGDLSAALDSITLGANSRLWLIVPPSLAKRLTLMRDGGPILVNGMIGDIRVVASDAATTTATLVDASQLAGSAGIVTFDVGREATLDMSGGNSPNFSLWQRNCQAMKVERLWGFEILSSSAIALITDVSVTA